MKNNSTLHFKYIIGILIAIIIGLTSVNWSDVPQLKEYISFALTFASLLLAIIAIAYSFYSGESLSSTLIGIKESSEKISALSKHVADSNQDLREKVDKVDKAVEDYNDAVTKMMQSSSIEPSLENDGLTEVNDKKVTEFLEKSSPLGCMALLAACLSFKTGIPLNMSELTKHGAKNKGEGMYYNAYITAAASFGLLKLNHQSTYGLHVIGVNEVLKERIEEVLIKKYKEMARNFLGGQTELEALNFMFQEYYSLMEFFKQPVVKITSF